MCHHPQDMEVLPQMPAWLCLAIGNADSAGLHAKLSNCHCHPLWPGSPQGQRGGSSLCPPQEGTQHRLPAQQGWERGSRTQCADEMWQACNKPLVTVTFARQPLAG